MPKKSPQLGVLLALLCAGSMWFYVEGILIPRQRADAAAHGRPRGNLSDLYPRWLGARELLLHHRDPYSPEITKEIQAGYYGRVLDGSHPGDPKDQQGFAYPVYVVFLLAPTIGLPYPLVETGFLCLLVLLTAASVWLWLRAQGWPTPQMTMLILLTLGSFPAAQGIKLQQLSLVVGGMIAGCVALLAGGHLFVAGVLAGLVTIKPQLALPFTGWLLLWAFSDWRRRQRFVWGFGATMVALLGGAQLALPGWMGEFWGAIAAYRQYTDSGSLFDVLLTVAWGRVLTVMVIAATVLVSWRARRQTQDSSEFIFVTSLVLAATVVIVPMVAPYNQVLLLPGIFLLARNWNSGWRQTPMMRVLSGVGVLVVAWPWLATLALSLRSFFLPAEQVQRAWAVPLYSSLGIPLAVLGLLFVQGLHSRAVAR